MFVEYKSYLERRAKDPLLKKSTEKARTQIPLLGICFVISQRMKQYQFYTANARIHLHDK